MATLDIRNFDGTEIDTIQFGDEDSNWGHALVRLDENEYSRKNFKIVTKDGSEVLIAHFDVRALIEALKKAEELWSEE